MAYRPPAPGLGTQPLPRPHKPSRISRTAPASALNPLASVSTSRSARPIPHCPAGMTHVGTTKNLHCAGARWSSLGTGSTGPLVRPSTSRGGRRRGARRGLWTTLDEDKVGLEIAGSAAAVRSDAAQSLHAVSASPSFSRMSANGLDPFPWLTASWVQIGHWPGVHMDGGSWIDVTGCCCGVELFYVRVKEQQSDRGNHSTVG